MKILSIESSVVALPFDMGGPPPLFAGKPWTHLEILLVRVETDDGLVGWGEAFGHAGDRATRAALDSIVAPLIVGRDAADIRGLTRDVLHAVHLLGRNGPFVYAFSGIEIALWDLLGKRTGQPPARAARRQPGRPNSTPMPACCATATRRWSPGTPRPPAPPATATSSCTRSPGRTRWPRRTRPGRPTPASCSTSTAPGRCRWPWRWQTRSPRTA